MPIECPYCPKVRPMTGTRNIFRHLFLDHPDSERGRAILRALATLPLAEATTSVPAPLHAGEAGGRTTERGRLPSAPLHHP